MALFPGSKGEDILSWRGITEAVAELRGRSAEQISSLPSDEGIDLLRGVRGRLADEIAFEQRFSVEFSQAADALELARHHDDFMPLLPRFNRLAEEYFRMRGSVVALHTLCATYRDGLVRRAVQWVAESSEPELQGKPPAPYCCLASGSIGRGELTFCDDPSYVLIHGETPAGGTDYFETFTCRTRSFLREIGHVKSGADGTVAVKAFRRCGRTEWRREIVGEPTAEEQGRLAGLIDRADLRFICGDPLLAEEMLNVVWSMLDFRRGAHPEPSIGGEPAALTRPAFSPVPTLRAIGKSIAEMSTGLDFFSRLRLEKSGMHRGQFDLEQFALAPLVANIRMLAITGGLRETSTIDRMKGLQQRGAISVELTDRLLRAYHDFTALKISRQIADGCGERGSCFIDPHDLGEDRELQLRNGLEAVAGLENIAYLRFTEQG